MQFRSISITLAEWLVTVAQNVVIKLTVTSTIETSSNVIFAIFKLLLTPGQYFNPAANLSLISFL